LEAKVAGELLLKAKEEVPHGAFKEWVEANCGFSYSQAKRYMAVAKKLVDKPFDLVGSIEAFLGYEKPAKPTPKHNTPTFTSDDAATLLRSYEYALKIHARTTAVR
jgi:hypothetical protein